MAQDFFGHTLSLSHYLLSPFTWIFFGLGSFVGSFLNVCILRIPEKTFWSNSRSVCPHCAEPIPLWLNLPILGYFILRGKAKCCGKKLTPMYPAIELLTALAFAFIYWRFAFVRSGISGISIDPWQLIRFLHTAVFTSILIVCSTIDIRLRIIPDVISLPMIAVTPLVIWVHPELSWQSGLIGVLAGGGSLYAVAWMYWLFRRQVGLGMGDVKLLAGIGGWLGYEAVLPTILYGSVLGSVSGVGAMIVARQVNLRAKIPFGPFLALGALLHFFYGSEIQEFVYYTRNPK